MPGVDLSLANDLIEDEHDPDDDFDGFEFADTIDRDSFWLNLSVRQ